jgi:ABC-type nickel/cobalt efflux system permease component RcnA
LVPRPPTLFIVVMATSMGLPAAGLVFALATLVGVGFVLSLVGLTAQIGAARISDAIERFELAGRVVLGLGGAELLC